MKTPDDKRIIFTYHSLPSKNAALRWKARLVFEPGSTDEDVAEMEVFDGDGNKVASGILEFAGQRLKVKDGKTSISCGDFVKGKHEPSIWLHRAGHPSSPGVVTFE